MGKIMVVWDFSVRPGILCVVCFPAQSMPALVNGALVSPTGGPARAALELLKALRLSNSFCKSSAVSRRSRPLLQRLEPPAKNQGTGTLS